ncbi:MAG TPA: hypothetical protein VLO07_08785 [Thermoanaerobaculia bacterium]|nr:hypothetical protein [Thermoanaerobaculia bacterium]
MVQKIRFEELTERCPQPASVAGSVALELAGEPTVELRFAIAVDDARSLEAVRHARRSILREEWTRGRDPAEPSLEDAVFSPGEILWRVRPWQRDWCRQMLRELVTRANQSLAELSGS